MGELYLHDLAKYIHQYGCTAFVETGTGIGTGLLYAKQFFFQRLYSIEVEAEMYRRAIQYADKRTEIHNTDSIDGLNGILPGLSADRSILFWLDAHFPGADFQLRSYDEAMKMPNTMPLEKELNTILDHRPHSRDVFIIDDLRIWERGNYELGNWDRFDTDGGGGIGWILEKFPNHDHERDFRHQGFLILTPKGPK